MSTSGIILFLYILTEIVSELVTAQLFPRGVVVRTLVKTAFFSVYVFLIIPHLLKGQAGVASFRHYIDKIGLRISRPLWRIILVVVACFSIFSVSQLIGSLIYYSSHSGSYVFDFSRHTLFESRSIVSGVFEEIVFRGVILALLLDSCSERRAIVLSAGLFALIHLLNVLNPDIHPFWVLSQSTWAFGLGIMYAYLFMKMGSILPLILLHYLINAFVGVWFRGVESRDVVSALYGIPFFGLIPAGLSILLIRFLSPRLPDSMTMFER